MKSCYIEFSSNCPDEEKRDPIIFLHGMLETKMTWKVVGPAIAKNTGRKAYALDCRNHGASPWSSEMNFEVLTKDLAEFMENRCIRKAIVIGFSMGGRTAINFALKHPERVEALVIEDMTPRNVKSGPDATVSLIVKIISEVLKSCPPEMSTQEAKIMFLEFLAEGLGGRFVDAERLRKNVDPDVFPIIQKGDTIAIEVNLDAVTSMLKCDALVQDLSEKKLLYKGDVLFLYGSKPFFQLENDPTIPQLFPRAILKKIEGASHMIHLDSSEEFIEVVSQFILNRNLQRSKY